jgi:outer membrane beta-barrel protein
MQHMRLLLLIGIISGFHFAQAQTASELDALIGIKEDPKEAVESSDETKEPEKEESIYKDEQNEDVISEDSSGSSVQDVPIKSISNLGKLQPFNDIAVIQKRFLPKTSRFEIFPSLGLVANNAFFWNAILSAKIGYYFTESLGVEAGFSFISSDARGVTTNLEDNLSVEIEEIVIPESYMGLDFKWSPVYGKLGLSGDSIVPFDMYFLLGGGVTQTNQDTSPFTVHVGTGQIFAISKMSAFRWDLGWYFYSTDSKEGTISGSFTDMYLTVGLSLFFPDARYR